MSGDDWQAGDLALCVNDRRIVCAGCGMVQNGRKAPKSGHTATVVHIRTCGDTPTSFGRFVPCPQPVLVLDSGYSGITPRFRKIRPHVPDAEDRETIALLAGKPAKVEA